MSIPTIPMVNAPNLYINGFALSWTSTTVISVGTGHCRDYNDINDIFNTGTNNGTSTATTAAAITVTTTTKGAGGIDTGTVATSTFYAVHVIGDSTGYNATSAIYSLSATAPALPNGYDMFRRVGYVKTDGSSHFLPFWQNGSKMWYDAPIATLSATAAAAFTAQSLAVAVPVGVGQCQVTLNLDLLPNAAANFVEFRPTGSSSTAGLAKVSGDVAAVHHFDSIVVPAAVSAGALSVDWLTDAVSTVAFSVAAYNDNL